MPYRLSATPSFVEQATTLPPCPDADLLAVGALLWGLALARVLAALARHEIFHAEATVAVLLVVGLPRALSAPLRWLARWLRSRSPISRLAAAP